MVKMVD
jgi:hypothetical protein